MSLSTELRAREEYWQIEDVRIHFHALVDDGEELFASIAYADAITVVVRDAAKAELGPSRFPVSRE